MRTFLEKIDGLKTYAVVILALVVILSYQLGWIEPETFNALLAALGFGGVATVRSALKKIK